MISVVYQFIAPTVGHMSVEYVLGLRGDGLHLPTSSSCYVGANYLWACKYAY